MTPPPWHAVVFDLDGTLADTIALIIASYEHAVQSVLRTPLDSEAARGWIGEPMPTTFGRLDPARAEELTDSYLEFNRANIATMIRPYEGVEELLSALPAAGLRVGVVTSKREESARLTRDLLALPVPLTVVLEDTDRHKPEPEPLLLALERLGVAADEAVYVGDAVVDVLAARAAGMDSIAVTWGAGYPAALRAAGPTAVVDTVAELATLLLGT
jgi:pyrophosphatase PpaX